MTRVLNFKKPIPPILLEEFVDTVRPLSLEERRACVFALLCNLPLSAAVLMRRSEAVSSGGVITKSIIESTVPHIKCDYLFWTQERGLALPLMNLESKFFQLTGKTWKDYRAAFGAVIFYWSPVEETSQLLLGGLKHGDG